MNKMNKAMNKATHNSLISRWRARRLRRRAAGNLARLFSAEITPQQVARIRQWRTGPGAYQKEFLATAHALADLDALAEDADILALVETDSSQPAPPARWLAWAPALAAMLVIAVGLGIFYTVEQEKPGTTWRYVTRIGEQKTVNLADGSHITLNTGTELLVSFTEESRRVLLERGEAYFAVSPDPQRPFTVNLGLYAVTVLGTEFDIFKTPEKFTLAVVQGTVSLHEKEDTLSATAPILSAPQGGRVMVSGRGQHRITAGTVTEFNLAKQEMVVYRPPAMDRFQSWRTGLIRFDEEPLYLVVQELNRYSSKKILIEDSAIMDLKIYATVRLDQLDRTLVGLENSLPIKVVRHFDRIVLTQADD